MERACQGPTRSDPVTVNEIARRFGGSLKSLSPDQHRVLRALERCRTAEMGGRKLTCCACGEAVHLYNSCRDRHCPLCQGAAREQWVRDRLKEILPIPYFHVVFTIPAILRPLALRNKRALYDILFRSASETILEVAKRRLGATVGALMVLHTWGQALMDHPHVHVLVTGGGLSTCGTRWIHGRSDWFLPVRALSKVYRGKFLDYLGEAYGQGELAFPGAIADHADLETFVELLRRAAERPWVVYAKRPFAGAEQVLRYLGRYTHRVAISNGRLVKCEEGEVTFRYRDYARGNEERTMTLDAEEFLRRFLLHTLPKGFKRIRSYGICGHRVKGERLERCRRLICEQAGPGAMPEMVRSASLAAEVHKPACPNCGCEEFTTAELPRRRPGGQAVPQAAGGGVLAGRPQGEDTS